eukprot:SAG31_NODE_46768_length_253_cov_0.662338_1_plen_24_part_10
MTGVISGDAHHVRPLLVGNHQTTI